MIPSRANVVRVGSNQSELASEAKLQVPLGQGSLGLLALTNIDGHVDDADDCTCTIMNRCRIGNDGDANTVSALKDRLLSSHGPTLRHCNLGGTILWCHRRATDVIEARNVRPSMLSQFGTCSPKIDCGLITIGDATGCVRHVDSGRERP